MKRFYAVVAVTVLLFLGMLVWTNNTPDAPFLIMVLLSGALGALVREQAHLRRLFLERSYDLEIHLRLALFSPIAGAILALMAGALFASGLVEGALFPTFTGLDRPFGGMPALQRGLGVASNQDLFKLLMWSVVAGFSERTVISRLQQLAVAAPGEITGEVHAGGADQGG